MKQTNEDLITSAEAQEMLGVSRHTLYARIREGEIKPLPKPPGAKRMPALKFRRAEIEAYVLANNEEAA